MKTSAPAAARYTALAALAWTLGAAGAGCDDLPPGWGCMDSADDCEPGQICTSVNSEYPRCFDQCTIGDASTCPASEACSEAEPEAICVQYTAACTDHGSCWSGFACDPIAGQCVKCGDNGADPYCRGPLAPDGLTAAPKDGQVQLAWLPVDGATGYHVYMASEPGVTANSTEIASSAIAACTHTELDLSLTYYYRVSAENAWAEGPLSAEVSAVPRILAPLAVRAAGDDRRVTLTWDPVPDADRYNAYWATEAGVTADSNRLSNVASPFVHAPLENGSTYYYAVTAVDGPGESVLSDEVLVRTLLDNGTKLLAIDAEAYDEFGWSVALSGEYAIVGAPEKLGGGDNPIPEAGAAYVFHRMSARTWGSGTKLVAPSAQSFDRFGGAVAIDGEYAIVGAKRGAFGSDDGGAAYVFHRTSENTWDLGTKLVAPDAQPFDRFGNSVALAGDYAIVGAYSEDGGDGDPLDDAGAAYVFRRSGENTWEPAVKLVAPDADAGDDFGSSVAISGEYVIVGAPGEDGGDGNALSSAGAAYAFHRTGENTWELAAKLVAPDAGRDDNFGSSAATSGEYAIVGASGDDGGVAQGAGAAYVFRRTGENTWDSGVKLVAPDAQALDGFGTSVALGSDYAIVAAGGEDGGDGDPIDNAGAAYLFHRTGENAWGSTTKIVAPDRQEGDQFGCSVAVGSDHAIVGAWQENGGDGEPLSNAGAAYVFEY
jgi:hypothetical protein